MYHSFQHLSIVDDYPVESVSVTAPVIGKVAERGDFTEANSKFCYSFNMSYDYQYDNYGIHGFMGDLVMDFELQDEDNKEVLILCHHFSDSFSLCICQIMTTKNGILLPKLF